MYAYTTIVTFGIMIILFALLLFEDGYFSAYFVDLKTHEGSQRSWLDKACCGCLFTLRLELPKFNLFSVYKLQLEQLCDFVPLDSWFFILRAPPKEATTFLIERVKGQCI